MLRIALAVGWFAVIFLGCQTTKISGVCPESENIECLSPKICDMDQRRGCQVCRCSSVLIEDKERQDETRRQGIPQ